NIQGIIKNQTKQLFAFYESFKENNAGFSKPFVFIIINTIFGTQGGSVDLANFLKAGSQSFLSFASNVGSAVSGGVKGASVGTSNFLVKTEGAIGNAVNNIKNRASQPENIRTSVGFVNVGSKATR
ncbi:hypothetical protein VQM71_08310, partial [Helicobacter pylori]